MRATRINQLSNASTPIHPAAPLATDTRSLSAATPHRPPSPNHSADLDFALPLPAASARCLCPAAGSVGWMMTVAAPRTGRTRSGCHWPGWSRCVNCIVQDSKLGHLFGPLYVSPPPPPPNTHTHTLSKCSLFAESWTNHRSTRTAGRSSWPAPTLSTARPSSTSSPTSPPTTPLCPTSPALPRPGRSTRAAPGAPVVLSARPPVLFSPLLSVVRGIGTRR
eukprot:SAG22_NODE_433_length_10557_cov_6.586728_10_plen_221_part_00